MLTTRQVVLLLRVLLVTAFVAVLVLQFLSVPGTLDYRAEVNPDLEWRRWVLLGVLELELVGAQVVIVCTWMLLGMVQQDRIFSDDALRWVDGMIAALGVGWLAWAALSLAIVLDADDPGMPLMLAIMLLAGAVFILILLVMRALLRKATTLHTDLEGVI
ncbi:DUF2975 domain-containing protein [Nocardioides sp.]|uniref:DUF2975 domain-containing protein n=1 Tax=Nocardioides sp. TaxID=35761 RepID=UPI002ED30D5D